MVTKQNPQQTTEGSSTNSTAALTIELFSKARIVLSLFLVWCFNEIWRVLSVSREGTRESQVTAQQCSEYLTYYEEGIPIYSGTWI